MTPTLPDPLTERALFAALTQRVRDAGCFERCDAAYGRRLALLVPLFAALFASLLVVPPGLLWAALAFATALISVQLGIVSHDAGHRMVHRRRAINDLWGHFGMSFACGLSFTHWRTVHDQHHRFPQDEGRDPDVDYGLLFVVYDRAARAPRRGLRRMFLAVQHASFWPLGGLYSWGLRTDSVQRCLREPRRTRVDRWALAGHYVLWLVVPMFFVPIWWALLNYVAVSTVIGVNLLAIFAPNHMGMPSVESDHRLGYLRRQLITTRNVEPGVVVSRLMHGLEYQIEHHLYPGIGQPRLAAARRVVRAFCAEHGLPYKSTGFVEAHREVIRHLRRLAHRREA